VFGVIIATMGPETYSEGHIDAAVFDRADQALAMLEAGLPR
jgi:hypothetical protein